MYRRINLNRNVRTAARHYPKIKRSEQQHQIKERTYGRESTDLGRQSMRRKR
jgi:hypothetical protein